MNKKVLTNYRIDADSAEDSNQSSRLGGAKVLTQVRISPNESKIATEREKSQPRLDVLKNAHGVITALVVTCGCGEEITILLEY